MEYANLKGDQNWVHCRCRLEMLLACWIGESVSAHVWFKAWPNGHWKIIWHFTGIYRLLSLGKKHPKISSQGHKWCSHTGLVLCETHRLPIWQCLRLNFLNPICQVCITHAVCLPIRNVSLSSKGHTRMEQMLKDLSLESNSSKCEGSKQEVAQARNVALLSLSV